MKSIDIAKKFILSHAGKTLFGNEVLNRIWGFKGSPCHQWHCAVNIAKKAISDLEEEGLIETDHLGFSKEYWPRIFVKAGI